MNGITIKQVETKKELKKFIKFPFKLYKGNEYWVPPLIREELETLNPRKNPAFENAEAKLFIAYKNGEIVGRIAGILSHCANEKYKTKNLRFNWFDSINDFEVAKALFDSIESWGRELGMLTLTGPHGFTDLDPEGMLVEGFDQLPTIAVLYNYPYYNELVEKYGFVKEIDYVEFRSKVPLETGVPERLLSLAEKVKQRSKIRVLKFKSKKQAKKRGEELFQLLDEAFEEIYGSVPLTKKQIQYYIKKYLPFVSKDLLKAVVNDQDEMIGFMITMPSLSKAFQKAKGRLFPFGLFHILKALKEREVIDFYLAGVKKKYRGLGVDLLMVVEIVKTAVEEKFKYAESNPELETNTRVQAQWKYFNPVQHKRRRIYKKNISY